MTGPLDGYRIIDLTTMIVGPLATMMLGDQGADVVKVEIPGRGDQTRAFSNRRGGLSASFINNNRNKRSITIDLKHGSGQKVLARLCEEADVFVQNFRPGVVDRLGIGEPALRRINPGIVYVSITGFGETGPFAHKPVYDPLVQAVSGLASIQGGSDRHRPRLIRTILPDKLSALTAALLARARTGEGRHVRLSLLDAVLAFLWSSDMSDHTYLTGESRKQRAATFMDLIYETKDGFMSVSIMTDAQWAGLARAAERPDLIDDARFRTVALRDVNIEQRLALTQELLAARTTAEWMARLEAEDVPCAPVLTRGELVAHPQIQANGTLVEYDHPQAGRLRQARPAARFGPEPARIARGAPQLGEHTDEVLAQAGFSDSEIARLRADKAVGW